MHIAPSLLFVVVFLAVCQFNDFGLTTIVRFDTDCRKTTILNFLLVHPVELRPESYWGAMRNNNMEYSLVRVFILVHEKLLAVLHTFLKILICLWILVPDVVVMVFVIYKVYSIQVFINESFLLLWSFYLLSWKPRDWI